MIDDEIIIPIVNPHLFLASRTDITGMHYSACCNLDLACSVSPADQHAWQSSVVRRFIAPSARGHATAAARDRHDRVLHLPVDPGGPAGIDRRRAQIGNPAIVAAARQKWGLNGSLPEQYCAYVKNLVQGDLGIVVPHTPTGHARSARPLCRPRSSWRSARWSSAVSVGVALRRTRRARRTSSPTTSAAASRCSARRCRCSGSASCSCSCSMPDSAGSRARAARPARKPPRPCHWLLHDRLAARRQHHAVPAVPVATGPAGVVLGWAYMGHRLALGACRRCSTSSTPTTCARHGPWACRAAGDASPCAAQRVAADAHDPRLLVRPADHRRGAHRDHLPVERHRLVRRAVGRTRSTSRRSTASRCSAASPSCSPTWPPTCSTPSPTRGSGCHDACCRPSPGMLDARWLPARRGRRRGDASLVIAGLIVRVGSGSSC